MANKPLQEQLYRILKPIRYKKPGPLYRRRITPADGLLLDFPHLPDEDILLLQRMRTIAPVSDAEAKQAGKEAAAAAAAETKAAKAQAEEAAKAQAEMKAAANQKMEVANNNGQNS